MAGNQALNLRYRSPKDEFYTQLTDVEAELRHYKDQFRDQVVLCNWDDPYESAFWTDLRGARHLALHLPAGRAGRGRADRRAPSKHAVLWTPTRAS